MSSDQLQGDAAWVFSSHGSQYVGTALGLTREVPEAATANSVANEVLDFAINYLMITSPEDDQMVTANRHPAIVAISAACLLTRPTVDGILKPTCVAVQSIGDYSTLISRDAPDRKDGMRLVRRRRGLMSDRARWSAALSHGSSSRPRL